MLLPLSYITLHSSSQGRKHLIIKVPWQSYSPTGEPPCGQVKHCGISFSYSCCPGLLKCLVTSSQPGLCDLALKVGHRLPHLFQGKTGFPPNSSRRSYQVDSPGLGPIILLAPSVWGFPACPHVNAMGGTQYLPLLWVPARGHLWQLAVLSELLLLLWSYFLQWIQVLSARGLYSQQRSVSGPSP